MLFRSNTRFGRMAHAQLKPAEENSGRLVTIVRQDAADRATNSVVILDGSPGTGCPVIASITASTLAVLVAEATVSGASDLVRVLDLARHFKIPSAVIINKADISPSIAERIRGIANEFGSPVIGELDYDAAFVDAQLLRQTLLEFDSDGETAKRIRLIWERIAAMV